MKGLSFYVWGNVDYWVKSLSVRAGMWTWVYLIPNNHTQEPFWYLLKLIIKYGWESKYKTMTKRKIWPTILLPISGTHIFQYWAFQTLSSNHKPRVSFVPIGESGSWPYANCSWYISTLSAFFYVQLNKSWLVDYFV